MPAAPASGAGFAPAPASGGFSAPWAKKGRGGGAPAFGTPAFGAPASGSFGAPPFGAPAAGGFGAGPAARPRRGSGGGKTVLKVLGILGGIGVLGVVLCVGTLGTIGYVFTRHSGWEEVTLEGYRIKMPPGKQQTKTEQTPLATFQQTTGKRRESGSEYIIAVGRLSGPFSGWTIDDLSNNPQTMMMVRNRRTIERNGVRGFRGTMTGGSAMGAEAEMFIHNQNMIIVGYAPYSEIKDRVGGKRSPRSNEAELDKPEEFFESLKFP